MQVIELTGNLIGLFGFAMFFGTFCAIAMFTMINITIITTIKIIIITIIIVTVVAIVIAIAIAVTIAIIVTMTMTMTIILFNDDFLYSQEGFSKGKAKPIRWSCKHRAALLTDIHRAAAAQERYRTLTVQSQHFNVSRLRRRRGDWVTSVSGAIFVIDMIGVMSVT